MFDLDVHSLTPDGIGYCALRLAMSRSIDEEASLKKICLSEGIRFVVTEVGGNTLHSFQEKCSRSLIGAALNAGLIEKNPVEIHALLHAAEEAKQGVILNTSSEANLAVKVAIVRTDHWISVAFFGLSAIHPMTGHERCGLGVMHI